MDIKQRRWLYSLFILLFLIISPLIIAYALGYRLDSIDWKISKVGALYIKSYPAGARIYVDDKLTKRKTPSQVINIPVGKNTFKLEKDSYQPWTKTMTISAGDTTFIQDILLFKQDFKKQTLGAGGSQLTPSRNDDAYLYINQQQELVQINTTNRATTVVGSLPANSKIQQWSDDERTLVYSVGSAWFTMNLSDGKSTQIITKPAKTITKALLGNDATDIFLLSNKTLFNWDLTSQTLTIINANVKDFTIGDGQLAFLTDSGLSLSGLHEASRPVSALDTAGNLTLDSVTHDFALLMRGDQYWIWRDGQIEQRINATTVDRKKNTLLFSNGYELSSYDISSHLVSVVDRTSIASTNVSWHPSTNYFARVQNTVLDLVELDSRGDKRHVVPISTIGSKDSYIFDPKGEYIFILTPEESYSLQLQ